MARFSRRYRRTSRKLNWQGGTYYNTLSPTTSDQTDTIYSIAAAAGGCYMLRINGCVITSTSATATAQNVVVALIVARDGGTGAPIQATASAEICPSSPSMVLGWAVVTFPAAANPTPYIVPMSFNYRSVKVYPGQGLYLHVIADQTVASDAINVRLSYKSCFLA